MSNTRRLCKVALTAAIGLIFSLVSLAPDLTHPAVAEAAAPPPPSTSAPQPAAVGVGPSLGVPEDPLSRQAEQQSPEVSVNVDVRDGHLIARVVDDWGSGRIPLLSRTFTNADLAETSSAGNWQVDQLLDIVPPCSDITNCLTLGVTSFRVRERDGNRGTYTGTYTGAYTTLVKNIGTYSSMTFDITCERDAGCTWGGSYFVALPKGITRRFQTTAVTTTGLITEERDASGNVTAYGWTTAVSGHQYVATITDPVGRVTRFAYETTFPNRLTTITDPYGRVVTYTYDASNHLISVRNSAGQTTSYGYSGDLLTSITDARGAVTTIAWTCAPCTPTPTYRVSQVIAPGQSPTTSTTYAYPLNGPGKTVVTDANGFQTTYEDGRSR
jgi:YD repeat-containing protein